MENSVLSPDKTDSSETLKHMISFNRFFSHDLSFFFLSCVREGVVCNFIECSCGGLLHGCKVAEHANCCLSNHIHTGVYNNLSL